MHLLETQLYDFMVQNGVDALTAQEAAKNCARSVTRSAGAGFVLGTTAGVATGNPAALLMGGVGAFGGGALALSITPTCSEVRQAAQTWATQSGL
jgi:hypothetical protein